LSRFDPWAELGVPEGTSLSETRVHYERRQEETNLRRVLDMDPAIRDACREARGRVELAWKLVNDPDSVSPDELPGAVPEVAKSYFKAVGLSLMIPGAGSAYSGGRLRGLAVFGVFCIACGLGMKLAMSGQAAAPARNLSENIMQMQSRLEELSRWTMTGVLLATVDAVLATWAHNDRLTGKRAARPLPGSAS
jgi:hypothetical protein